MGDTVKELPRFFSTEDVRKILKIGNKACLELFHREDFPCKRVGKSYRIAEESINEYFKTRRVHKEQRIRAFVRNHYNHILINPNLKGA